MSGTTGTEPEWEYVPMRLGSDVSRLSAAAQLSLQAEFGGWELARVTKFHDGTRRVTLRRRLTKTSVPLPGLSR